MISAQDISRLQSAVGSQQAGNDIFGAIGLKGGFACTSSGGVLAGSVTGPFVVLPNSGGEAGSYRVYPQVNGAILSLDWINVNGFTPRNPGAAETCAALVTGYAIDSANNQWYITVQVATLSSYAINPTPPQNFVVGVAAAVSLSSNSNPL